MHQRHAITKIHHDSDELVPDFVFSAVSSAVADATKDGTRSLLADELRYAVADALARYMNPRGRRGHSWRFCKCYRMGITPAHELIFNLVSTVEANFLADRAASSPEAA